MKFRAGLATFLLISIYLSSVSSLNLKSTSSTGAETTIMEFLGNLYKAGTSEENSSQNYFHEPTNVQQTTSNTGDPSKLLGDDKELQIAFEGWLRISSKQFTNDNYYPTLRKKDYSPEYISVEDGTTQRINKLFDTNRTGDANWPKNKFQFYFRMSFRNFYYTYNKLDFQALGSIPTDQIINVEEKQEPVGKQSTIETYCFYIRDNVHSGWELCAESNKERRQWMCKIKEVRKIQDDLCSPKEIEKVQLAETPVTEFERRVNQPIILIPQPNRFCNEEWNYEAQGRDWECDCKEGTEQSPIDIPTSKVIKSPVVPVFTYNEVEVKKTENTADGQVRTHTYIKMVNEEHQLQIKADSFGTVVTLDGTQYNAYKVVFHTPSEHKINGKSYPMEMQIIHKGVSDGAISNHLVLSFVFKKAAGVYNKFLDDVDFFNLPNPIAKEKRMENDLYIPKIFYNSDNEDIPIMKPFSMYTYQGSLTAPPCTESTIVYVAADPIEVGATAIQLFQEAIRMPDLRASNGDIVVSTETNENARSVQPLNGRNIFYYYVPKEDLSVLKKEFTPPKPIGHYEKMIRKINNYYYVNNNKPSGMPGALIVSSQEAQGKS